MEENTPQASPDLSGANPAPGSSFNATDSSPASSQSSMESVAPPNLTQANLPAYGEPGAASEPSTVVSAPAGKPVAEQPAAPPPHAKLLAMIQGLSVGLGAAAQSIATHGKEGGAAEVQRFQGEQQRQKEQADSAATAQKNAKYQQLMWQGEINHTNLSNIVLGATVKNQVDESHFKAQESGLGVIGLQQEQQAKAREAFNASGDLNTFLETTKKIKDVGSGASEKPTAGATPAAAAPAAVPGQTSDALSSIPPVSISGWKNSIDSAMSGYPNDPDIQKADAAFKAAQASTDPHAASMAMAQAARIASSRMTSLTAGAKARAEQQTADAGSPVSKLSTPEALAAPGAQAAIQAKIDDPTTAPADIPRLRPLLAQASAAQFNAENIKAREARTQQIVNQGTADDAGKLLANRSLTLSELKSRQVTPKFITDAVAAAQKYDPTYKAAEAEGQGKIAGSPANQQFFGNTDSLLVKGGTLDQLAQTHAALGNTSLPFANKLENWKQAQLGQGPQAAFAAAALGVADDASKVMSGGTGSDASRQQALDIIGRDLSNEGMAASIAQVRKQIESQRNGRVGTNPYLKDMYPDPSTRQEVAGQSGTQSAIASKFTADSSQPTRPASVSATRIHGIGPHGSGWYEPSIFGGK
jgi:hypothetical protein